MTDTPEADLPASENEVLGDSADDKKKKAAKWRNNMAVAALTMAFQTDELLQLIMDSMMADWPGD